MGYNWRKIASFFSFYKAFTYKSQLLSKIIICFTDINWDVGMRVCPKETSAKKWQNWALHKNLSARCKKRCGSSLDILVLCYPAVSWVTEYGVLRSHRGIKNRHSTQCSRPLWSYEKLHYSDCCLDNIIWDILLPVYSWWMFFDVWNSWVWRYGRNDRNRLVLVEFCLDVIISVRVYRVRPLAREILICSFCFAAVLCDLCVQGQRWCLWSYS